MEFARNLKAQDPTTTFRFGRNQIMYIESANTKAQYYVDAAGKILNYENKRGEAMDSSDKNSQRESEEQDFFRRSSQ